MEGKMPIKEYDIIEDERNQCPVCGEKANIVIDEEGEYICTDCLFERECEDLG